MKISEHITYREATRSITAQRLGINNKPNDIQLINMKLVAEKVFEPMRKALGGKPIKIESFFRCPKLNRAIGGSRNSQHMKGEAIDIDDDYGYIPNADMFYYIADNLVFDQLIWEFGNGINPGWVHVSYKGSGKNRKKISIAYKKHRRTYYKHFYKTSDFIIFKEQLYNNQ